LLEEEEKININNKSTEFEIAQGVESLEIEPQQYSDELHVMRNP
jgi:hypothetical protein